MEHIEKKLQSLNTYIRTTEQNLSRQVKEFEHNLGNRLNIIERILTQHDENIGNTEVQRARLRHQISILRRALNYYKSRHLDKGHQVLNESHLTDAQILHYRKQLNVISPYTTDISLNNRWLLLSGMGAAIFGILSFIKYDNDFSFRTLGEFDVLHSAWLGLSEIAAFILAISSFKKTSYENSIPTKLIDQIKNYLDNLEAALDKS